LFISVNDLDGVSKKRQKLNEIEENCDHFEHKNKIINDFTKFDEN